MPYYCIILCTYRDTVLSNGAATMVGCDLCGGADVAAGGESHAARRERVATAEPLQLTYRFPRRLHHPPPVFRVLIRSVSVAFSAARPAGGPREKRPLPLRRAHIPPITYIMYCAYDVSTPIYTYNNKRI